MDERLRILLIEDNPPDAELIRLMLLEASPLNFQIECAASLSVAIARLREHGIDLIFLDLGLPDSFGLETFYDIRKAAPQIPVIILTGYDDQETGIAAVREGAQDYLVKGQVGGSLLARAAIYAVERKQAEIRLQQAEEKYRSIFENTIEGIFQSTPGGIIISANPAFVRIYGYDSLEDIIKASYDFKKTQPYANPERKEEFVRLLSEKGSVDNFEAEMRKKDGNIIWVSMNVRTVCDDTGNIIYFEGTTEDITERRKAADALNKSKEIFAAIAAGSAIPQFAIDKSHNVILWNRAIEVYSGIKAEDILGRSDYWKAFYKEPRPCLVDLVIDGSTEEEISRCYGSLSTKSQLIDGAYEATAYFPYMKGGAWLYFTAAVVKDSSGNVMVGVETLDDITNLIAVESSLRESEAKYRTIFENAIEGIFQSTPGGIIISANPALVHIHGYDTPEELMSAISDIETQLYVNPERRKEYIRLLDEKGRIENFESEMYKKDGSRIWTSMNVRAVRDNTGNILYFEGTMEDITERKRSEENLARTVENLRRAIGTTIQVMVAAVESKDPYTAGHQRRTTDLARMIAKEMCLAQDTIEGIRMACLIHDIGKISIPTEILSKPTKLSDMEFSLIKTHSECGYNMLKDVESPWQLAEIVFQHHERLDGSGYPRGMKGDEILIEARIIAVADVVEATASHRPYRPAKGIDAALEEIERNAGILYDREVVGACIRLFKEKGFKFE